MALLSGTALRGFTAAVIAAAAALLSTSGMARATPVNFVLSGVTATFGPPQVPLEATFDFTGTFTFEAFDPVSETNIDVGASPASPELPFIVPGYFDDDSLCSGRITPSQVCFANQGPNQFSSSAILLGFAAPLTGSTTPDPVTIAKAIDTKSFAPFTTVFTATAVTGAAVVPEPPSLVLFVTALGLWLLRPRVTWRRPGVKSNGAPPSSPLAQATPRLT